MWTPPRFSTCDHVDWRPRKPGIILNVYQREDAGSPIKTTRQCLHQNQEQEFPRVGRGAAHLRPVIGFKHVSRIDRWLVETKWHFEGGVTPSLTLDRPISPEKQPGAITDDTSI